MGGWTTVVYLGPSRVQQVKGQIRRSDQAVLEYPNFVVDSVCRARWRNRCCDGGKRAEREIYVGGRGRGGLRRTGPAAA